MTELVGYLLLFLVVGVIFVYFHLMLGKMVRPAKPDAEKLTIYECGEPTIGSSWIQFDLRFYVVALLFVIFDVEVVFFFPWAVVFGKANTLANENVPVAQRNKVAEQLLPAAQRPAATEAGQANEPIVAPQAAWQLAKLAFWDILVFFGVLLVGFAYLWKRGDLDWVRSTMAERAPTTGVEMPLAAKESSTLVGAGR